MTERGPPAPALDAGSFPHPVRRLEMLETHLSWVVLTGDYAYKIKKPVRFAFVDATTLESRHALCRAELELNRRLAPELYLDVVTLRALEGRLRFCEIGEIVDFAVRMRQFDRRDELSALLARGDATSREISSLAALLADFHARAATTSEPPAFATPPDVRRMIERNLDELLAVCPPAAGARVESLRRWIDQRFVLLAPLIADRRAHGRVREGHGDLHTRNIVRFGGRLVPFDCLEFDRLLRCGDVALDLAFLYMDLRSKRRDDLATVLLDSYCEHGGDYEALEILDFYAVHRALVRAKVDALQAAGAASKQSIGAAERALVERLDVAERLSAPRDPALVLMHGLSGSGKSWVSAAAVSSLPAVRVRSDVERRRILGLGSTMRSGSVLHGGAYAADVTDRTYQRLRDAARSALRGGHHVIVDATFLDSNRREPFVSLARELGCRLLIASCRAPEHELRRRVAARASSGLDASEADIAVLEDQLRRGDALQPGEERFRFVIDTAGLDSAATAARALVTALQTAPRPARSP